MLGFEAERRVLRMAAVDCSTIEEIPGVKLDARLCGQHFHGAAAERIAYESGPGQAAVAVAQDEVMVVAARARRRPGLRLPLRHAASRSDFKPDPEDS